MTSSWLVRFLYVAILSVSAAERVRTETINLLTSSVPNRKQLDGGDNADVTVGGKSVDEETNDGDVTSSAAADKRKWGEKTMTSWGKRATPKKLLCVEDGDSKSATRSRRRWGENSMSAWGKRSSLAAVDCLEEVAASAGAAGKRKWGEKTMQVWGKRAATSDAGDDDLEAEKRKWGEKSMSAWGKRLASSDDGAIKRKWGSNSMQVWGKRGPPSHQSAENKNIGEDSFDEDDSDDSTQLFDGDSSMSRHPTIGRPKAGAVRPSGKYWGPKRKWETNTMKVWGKRALNWRGELIDDE